jgi:SAM-dependent methyltransferase
VTEARFKTVCILGRQPALGLAELERLYGPEHIMPINKAALLDIDSADINFKRMGGTVKVAKLLAIIDSTGWPRLLDYLLKNIPNHLRFVPAGKFTLGISLYGLDVPLPRLNKDVLKLKKAIKETGRPVRVIPNKSLHLNSAQVLHNQLTSRGAWELVLIRSGSRTILAQTMFVQDIDAYAARDQARPKRDAKVGMLPPKLAQIVVNLAAGQLEAKLPQSENKALGLTRLTVLDPFCGSGVILQEALLNGYSVIGSDIETRMVDYARHNLLWLVKHQPQIQGRVVLEAGDATEHQWPPFSIVASEAYLGRPLNSLPPTEKLKPIINDVNTILKKFLKNLAPQMKRARQICLAVPAWRKADGSFIHLPLIDQITDMGYNYLDLKHVPREDLIYSREGQTVARQLLILEKHE